MVGYQNIKFNRCHLHVHVLNIVENDKVIHYFDTNNKKYTLGRCRYS